VNEETNPGGAHRLRILSIFGTRPEAIKMAPVIARLTRDSRFESRVCLTGQHAEMLQQVVDLFGIEPDIDLKIMRAGQGLTHITAAVLEGLEGVLRDIRPHWVLVHGDTTTSTAAALAAFYAGVPVGHVEAGLRTRNLLSPWPEEANRQITGRLATLHFAPTERARRNLLEEAVDDARIIVTGNTVIDALEMISARLAADSILEAQMVAKFNMLDANKRLILVTGHRRENLDGGIERVCAALARIAKRGDVQILYPVHLNPKVRAAAEAELGGVVDVFLVPPQGYLEFVWLMRRATLVVTDSGGVQEEAPSFGKPVLVTRDTTERPEAVEAGTVLLTGTDLNGVVAAANELLDDEAVYMRMARAHNPYGDGRAAGRISDALLRTSRDSQG
jgi:UDP-N-acetylglucosamine 2-epimerase (non-hydrolysing)